MPLQSLMNFISFCLNTNKQISLHTGAEFTRYNCLLWSLFFFPSYEFPTTLSLKAIYIHAIESYYKIKKIVSLPIIEMFSIELPSFNCL